MYYVKIQKQWLYNGPLSSLTYAVMLTCEQNNINDIHLHHHEIIGMFDANPYAREPNSDPYMYYHQRKQSIHKYTQKARYDD